MEKTNSKLQSTGINNFILENQIGHGSSGICYKAISKVDGRVCVIKKISINSIKGNSFKLALKQVQVLKNVNHPNIVKFYDSFADDSYLYIVMEYAQKGDLYTVNNSFMKMLKKRKIKEQYFSQEEVWNMGRQLLEALQYLHGKNIVHRDFKTLNIFIGQNNNLLVGDLGVSKIIKNDMGLYSRVGTPLYLAPEIIKYEKYDFKADIWGLGCVMYIITSLSHPFEGKNIFTLGQSIMTTDPKHISGFSNELNFMIKSMLEKNPLKRPEAKFILTQYYSEELRRIKSSLNNKKHQETKHFSKTEISSKQIKAKNFISSDKIIQTNKLHFRKPCDENIQSEAKSSNSLKLFTLTSEKQQNIDQTVVMQPSIVKVDSQQEKTKLRDLFSFTRLQKSFSNDKKIQNIGACSSIMKQTEIFGKAQQRKSFTESNEEPKQEVKLDNFVRVRNVQSAKIRNNTQDKYDLGCGKQSKNFVRGSVSNMFFESSIKEECITNVKLRPKSSIGKRMMASNNDIKYIKKKAANQNLFTSMTKTFILKKPEMVII